MTTDYSSLIDPVARRLRGEPNAKASKPDELRFGTHGSLKVVPSKGIWNDHEADSGGGTLDLIVHEGAASDRAGAHAWLVAEGFVQAEPDAPRRGRPPLKPEVTYDYVDTDGVLVFQVVRKEGKRFMQRRPDPDKPGGWLWNLKGVERVLYRLPELLAAPADKLVFVVEGEKDCDRLRSLGLVATTNAGGAGKWTKQYNDALKGRKAVVIPDNDDAGRDHADKIVKSLKGTATSVQVLELADLPEKGDVSDWLDAGHTSDELLALVQTVEPEKSVAKEREPSQTDALVAFVQDRFDLAHDENRDGIAIKRDTCEVFRLNSRSFKDGLLAGFQRHVGKTVRDANLSEALMNLQATARTTGEPCKVNLRVGHAAGEYYIDLGKPGDSRTYA